MLVQFGLCRTCSETTLLVFPKGGSNPPHCEDNQFLKRQPLSFAFRYIYITLLCIYNRAQVIFAVQDLNAPGWYKTYSKRESDQSISQHFLDSNQWPTMNAPKTVYVSHTETVNIYRTVFLLFFLFAFNSVFFFFHNYVEDVFPRDNNLCCSFFFFMNSRFKAIYIRNQKA